MITTNTVTTNKVPANTVTSLHPAGSSVVANLRGVTKRYGDTLALKNVSMEVRGGEVLALLGPNGAGKTTAVNLMLGVLSPTAGEVRVFGQDPREPSHRTRVGAMLQAGGAPDTLKVGELLELFSSYYPAPLAKGYLLEMAGLTELKNRPFGKLSGGQGRRLVFALALCGDPELLFLDEPTTGLDVNSRRGLWDGVRSFIAEGKSVLLTTHYLEEADALADRIVVLNHGRVVAQGTPTEVKARTAGRRVRCVTNVALDLLRALPQVKSAERDGAVTDLLVTKAEPVVAELLRRDPDLSDLEVAGAGLEEAFLALTDRRAEA